MEEKEGEGEKKIRLPLRLGNQATKTHTHTMRGERRCETQPGAGTCWVRGCYSESRLAEELLKGGEGLPVDDLVSGAGASNF